jgi:hypothetical protein
MNNHIKQLAIQAELNVTLLFNKDKLERFAELIICECINQLNKPEYAMNHPEDLSDYNRGWVNGRLLGIEHIEQHFRVAE